MRTVRTCTHPDCLNTWPGGHIVCSPDIYEHLYTLEGHGSRRQYRKCSQERKDQLREEWKGKRYLSEETFRIHMKDK